MPMDGRIVVCARCQQRNRISTPLAKPGVFSCAKCGTVLPAPADASSAPTPAPRPQRYRAFLSYSHSDRKAAAWLHRKLESYRVPRALVSSPTPLGPVPATLGRVFRDDAEFAASDNLGAAIEEALAESGALIVLCSPDAARSQWVNAEIKRFTAIRPDGKVLALAVRSDPGSEIIPPALLQQQRREQALGSEPFVPDLRQDRRTTLIRLAAALLGLRFDDLYRRERRRRLTRIFGASAAGAAALLMVGYAAVWNISVSRSRALAAAAAYEINQGKFDRAAALALSGLPKPGSLLDVFWPADAEMELRRTGLHQIKTETLIPKRNGANFSILKDRFVVTQAEDAPEVLLLTDIVSGDVIRRGFGKACEGARTRGGGGDGCAIFSFDTDDAGKRLLLALMDGSVWRVEGDGSAAMLTAPQCFSAWKEIVPGTKVSDYGPCKHGDVRLSHSGRTAVVQRAETIAGYDFNTGTSWTIDDSRVCNSASDKAMCQLEALRVIAFRGDDVLLRRRGNRTTMWFLSEGGVARDVPVPMDHAVSGPNSSFTGYSSKGYAVTQIIPAIRQTLEQGMIFNLGRCDSVSPTHLKSLALSLGCRVTALAISPTDSDMAVASTAGEIHIKHLSGGSSLDIPDTRKITIDCQPGREKLFKSLSLDKPRSCTVTAMRFGAGGTALAALGDDDRLRVFRINNGPIRRGDGALLATVALPSSVRFFGFDAEEETLIVVLENGVIRKFDLIAPASESLLKSASFKRPRPAPSGLGALRRAICDRLGHQASPLIELNATDFGDIQARFPGLQLAETDRRPCAQR
jgi:TIR domain-containing protein